MSFSNISEIAFHLIVASVYDIITYMHVRTQLSNLLEHGLNGT